MNIVCDTLKKHEKDQQSTQTLMRCSFHSEKCSLKLIDYYHHFYLCDVFSCFLYSYIRILIWFLPSDEIELIQVNPIDFLALKRCSNITSHGFLH